MRGKALSRFVVAVIVFLSDDGAILLGSEDERRMRLAVRRVVRGNDKDDCHSSLSDEITISDRQLSADATLFWVLCERLTEVREIVAREHSGQVSCNGSRFSLFRMRVEMKESLRLNDKDADRLETLFLFARDEILELMEECVRRESLERAELADRRESS